MEPVDEGAVVTRVNTAVLLLVRAAPRLTLHSKVAPAAEGSVPQSTATTPDPVLAAVATTPAGKTSAT